MTHDPNKFARDALIGVIIIFFGVVFGLGLIAIALGKIAQWVGLL
jgi:hypothetical protein